MPLRDCSILKGLHTNSPLALRAFEEYSLSQKRFSFTLLLTSCTGWWIISCDCCLKHRMSSVCRIWGCYRKLTQSYFTIIWQEWTLRRWTKTTNISISERSTPQSTHWHSPLAMCEYDVITLIAPSTAHFTRWCLLLRSNSFHMHAANGGQPIFINLVWKERIRAKEK